MADFELAVPVILKHEGGLVSDPTDPGGTTKYGVSLRFALAELAKDGDGDGWLDGDFDHDGDVDENDIRAMGVGQATEVYRTYFWDRYGYGRIGAQDVALKVFDMCVNMGSKQAHKIVQRALVATGCTVTVDGALGPVSLGKLNAIAENRIDSFLVAIRDQQAQFYRGLVAQKPALAKYLNGWLNRTAAC